MVNQTVMVISKTNTLTINANEVQRITGRILAVFHPDLFFTCLTCLTFDPSKEKNGL